MTGSAVPMLRPGPQQPALRRHRQQPFEPIIFERVIAMTRNRWIVLIMSGAVCVLSIGASYLAAGFGWRLGCFFVSCLAFFHAGLAGWVGLTKRMARSSDYIYFTFGALGLLIASFANTPDRNQYYAAVAYSVGNPNLVQLSGLIDRFLGWCVRITPPGGVETLSARAFVFIYGDKLDDETCRYFKGVADDLKRADYADLPALITKQAARVGTNRLKFGVDLSQMTFLVSRLALESALYFNGGASKAQQDAADDGRLQAAAFKYLYSSLWPFVLAFALSLRITRVTADVSDWPVG